MGEIALRDVVAVVCTKIASDDVQRQIAQALPPGVTIDRFTRTALVAVQQNPELVTVVDKQSIYLSLTKCAKDGLLPDGREAALVIYDKQVQYLPMIGGLRKIAAKHGYSLNATVVYGKDEFAYQLGLDPGITHRPPPLDEARGEPIGAYAVATDKASGEKFLEVMSKQEIEKVRSVSRAGDKAWSPWVKWWDEMARKTVARRLWKQLPFGDLDEHDARILDQADADTELPSEPKMTVEDANISAGIGAVKPPTDAGPDDTLDGEIVGESDGDADGAVGNSAGSGAAPVMGEPERAPSAGADEEDVDWPDEEQGSFIAPEGPRGAARA